MIKKQKGRYKGTFSGIDIYAADYYLVSDVDKLKKKYNKLLKKAKKKRIIENLYLEVKAMYSAGLIAIECLDEIEKLLLENYKDSL